MKVTRLGDAIPKLIAGYGFSNLVPAGGTAGQVVTADGSNGVYWGENVARITANGSNIVTGPFVNFAAGSNIILAVSSNTLNIASTGGGSGSISAGSNSTAVAEISSAGASTTLWSPFDHQHAGIATITASSSNTLQRGTWNLRAGTGIALSLTDTDGDGEFDTTTVVNTLTPGSSGFNPTIVYPTLKPASPDFDFTSPLSGWTAVNTGGSFTAAGAHAQAVDGSQLFLPFWLQSGFIYQSASNVDQEWICGDLISSSRITNHFIGIALLDSSNNGMGVIYHTSDNTAALIKIAAGVWDNVTATVIAGSPGNFIGTPSRIWLRLTRVGNTWDGYFSMTGVAWEAHAPSTLSSTITVSRRAVGVWTGTSSGMQQMTLDWLDTV